MITTSDSVTGIITVESFPSSIAFGTPPSPPSATSGPFSFAMETAKFLTVEETYANLQWTVQTEDASYKLYRNGELIGQFDILINKYKAFDFNLD